MSMSLDAIMWPWVAFTASIVILLPTSYLTVYGFLEIELKTFFFNENMIDLVYDGVAKAFHHRCDGLFSFDALPRFRVRLVLREHLDLF